MLKNEQKLAYYTGVSFYTSKYFFDRLNKLVTTFFLGVPTFEDANTNFQEMPLSSFTLSCPSLLVNVWITINREFL